MSRLAAAAPFAAIALLACTDESASRLLNQYLETLNSRVAEAREPGWGTSEESTRLWMASVQETCARLLLVNATTAERLKLNTTQRAIFQDRVSACIELLHYRVDPDHYETKLSPTPSPTLRDRSRRELYCGDSLLAPLCSHWGMP
jgi:hypothetical protein